MRMSCNGCRVLRKGCGESCSIRPCLQWIKNPQSQANATLFLAKFYGRAGLINLINAGPDHLRPAIFRSLLYEACGRMVNPIYGSVGLLWSGSWQLCQAAVEAVLKGAPITQIPSETAACAPIPPLKGCDIRHVSKEQDSGAGMSSAELDLHKVAKTRTRFKRSGAGGKPKPRPVASPAKLDSAHQTCYAFDLQGAPSHESSGSHSSEQNAMVGAGADETSDDGDGQENESMETVEASQVSQAEQSNKDDEDEVELELTLGFEPVAHHVRRPACPVGADTCRVGLGLELPAPYLHT